MRAHVQLITKEKKNEKKEKKGGVGGGGEVKGFCGRSGGVFGLSRDSTLIIAGNIGIIEPAL